MLHRIRNLLVVCSLAALAACGGDDDHDPNIVQVAAADARFSILVEAVTAADLAGTLSGPGPLTVFAPTNDAFALLLTDLGLTKAQLLADKPLLTAVLTYHVLPAKVLRADVPAGQAITTLQGGIFKVEPQGGNLVIQDGRNRNATITATDLMASNGVIHVIDRVLLPADKNIVQTALALPDFSLLAEAVVAAELVDALSAPGPFTVFAPTNTAFVNLLAELQTTKEALFANKPLLTSVLKYHVVNARVLKSGVPVGAPISTLETGKTFSVSNTFVITDGSTRTSNITATDVFASNGVIHVIDKVLLPSP